MFVTVPALRCTAEEALHRVRDTRLVVAGLDPAIHVSIIVIAGLDPAIHPL
ncbi:MAG TPA: hypothetical protein VGO49_22810 [Bradyrhizobium sp.]|jgi:hypothetical protein|nr:hypothetical protein [Bradyrhizobium sp.]